MSISDRVYHVPTPAGAQRSPGPCHRAAFLLRSQQLRPSRMVAFSLGPGWNEFGPAVIRVWTAKSAGASDHLLHAHFVGWQTAIVMKGTARISARAPRHLSGLADAKVEQHCHRHGSHDEHESHGRLHPDDTGRFLPHVPTPYYHPATNTRIARRSVLRSRTALRSRKGCATSHLRLHRQRSFAEARRAERCPTSSHRRARCRAAIDPY